MKSSRPYLIRAMYEWILDNHLTPHVVVNAELPGVIVPNQYIQDGKIVLNISPMAIDGLALGNNLIEFQARFSGKMWHVQVPIAAAMAIYAKENGKGMIFSEEDLEDSGDSGTGTPPPEETPSATKKGKPKLKLVK